MMFLFDNSPERNKKQYWVDSDRYHRKRYGANPRLWCCKDVWTWESTIEVTKSLDSWATFDLKCFSCEIACIDEGDKGKDTDS